MSTVTGKVVAIDKIRCVVEVDAVYLNSHHPNIGDVVHVFNTGAGNVAFLGQAVTS